MKLEKMLSKKMLLVIVITIVILPTLYSIGQTLGVFVSTELVKLLQHLI